MSTKEIIAEIKLQGLPIDTPVFKIKVIDGNDGSSDIEYFLNRDERDQDAECIEYPYFFERSTVTFKATAFA